MFRREFTKSLLSLSFFSFLGVKPKDNEECIVVDQRKDTCCVIDVNGTTRFYKNGQIHRDNDKPAIIREDGSKHWYQNGQLHRDNDLPAIIWDDGTQFWYKHGKLYHNRNKPTAILAKSLNDLF